MLIKGIGMDIRQLRYFTTIIDEGGVRKAAATLHVSQPALTMAVKALESELDVKLFSRSGRSLVATREGLHLYRHAQPILAQARKVKAEMAALTSLENVRIQIASPVMIAQSILAEPLARFMVTNPDIRLQLSQMGSRPIERALLRGDVEIGFVSLKPDTADLATRPLFETPLRCLVNRAHPLASASEIGWDEILQHKLATIPQSYALFDTISRHARFHKRQANIILETDNLRLLSLCLKESNTIALLLEGVIRDDPDLTSLPIRSEANGQNDPAHVIISACYLKDTPLGHAAETLLEFLSNWSKATF